ncbi:MAG TPA: 4-hydroxy-tetrahydrodipicolinate reductase [Bacteroidia bacterium]|nr:4-hydroxy-tetrahydrodipicolinate reductase [Bacteroidia bacterium]HNT80603.1 4-hydroxy-tetrahydrodipicolinate reductase [Bacteroidia bacterium]
MKIALIGYGKMGKTIEAIGKENGHEFSFRIQASNAESLKQINKDNTDVAIEFSNPESAFSNIKFCIEQQIPVVSGTTGWLDKKEELDKLCLQNNAAFLYASNFSIGVNLFFMINRYAAELFSAFPSYRFNLKEIHHTEKKDAPSGTAISLANDIIKNHPHYQHWKLKNTDTISNNDLIIESVRESGVPGTHHISIENEIDRIELSHTAHNRKGFAAGALMAAEWICNKKGVFTMENVLNPTLK